MGVLMTPRHRVHADALLCVFDRERFCRRVQAPFLNDASTDGALLLA